jgi:folylpolyglutamate synthase
MRKAGSSSSGGGNRIGGSFDGVGRRGDDEDDEDDEDERLFRTALEDLYGLIAAAATNHDGRVRNVRDMKIYLLRIGPLSLPPCLHIAGTKGKGSTAAMCEEILRERYHLQTGLFTSPHLVDVRERIRIMGRPVSKGVFGNAYWHVRELLLDAAKNDPMAGVDDDLPPPTPVPGYFRMLTVLALYIFANHRDPSVDVMIVEAGMGGLHDATNVLEGPKVCGIALLDYDHVQILGNTLEQIAAEKVGIYSGCHPKMQSGSVCYVLDTNLPSPLRVIKDHVEKQGGCVKMVGRNSNPVIPLKAKLGLPGRHQRDNVELAVALCQEAIRRYFPELGKPTPEGTAAVNADGEPLLFRTLATVSWPGRCQTLTLPEMTLYLDGAHTLQSVATGLDWFEQEVKAAESSSPDSRSSEMIVLVFSCSHERNAVELLELLCRTGLFQMAVFARPDSEKPSATGKPTARALLAQNGVTYRPELQVTRNENDDTTAGPALPSWQDSLATIWKHLMTMNGCERVGEGTVASPGPMVRADGRQNRDDKVLSSVSVPEALQALREQGDLSPTGARKTRHVRILVTGSLYLVGSVLSTVGWKEEDATGSLAIPDSVLEK